MDHQPVGDEVRAAKERVKAAVGRLAVDPGLIFSTYLNGVLQSARMDALTEFMMDPLGEEGDGSSPQQFLNALIVKHLNRIAEAMEAENASPHLYVPSARAN